MSWMSGEEGGVPLQTWDRRSAGCSWWRFEGTYGEKYPKAVAKLTNDRETLLTFPDHPAHTGCIC